MGAAEAGQVRGSPGVWTLTCDPGIDDAVALAVAAGVSGAAPGAVVAGAGNVPVDVAWRNAAGMVALLGLDVPVAAGSATALDGSPLSRGASSHGADGLGGLAGRLPPVDDRPGPHPPPVRGDVIATGPLTDVARALSEGAQVTRVVWMGGSHAGVTGVDPVGGEFNAAADARAADVVLAAGVPVRVVPVEITAHVTFAAGDVAPWRSGPPVARLCADLVDHRRGGRWPVLLHDPVAVVAGAAPHLFRWEAAAVRCLPDGRFVPAYDGRAPVEIAGEVSAAAVRRIVAAAVRGVGRSG